MYSARTQCVTPLFEPEWRLVDVTISITRDFSGKRGRYARGGDTRHYASTLKSCIGELPLSMSSDRESPSFQQYETVLAPPGNRASLFVFPQWPVRRFLFASCHWPFNIFVAGLHCNKFISWQAAKSDSARPPGVFIMGVSLLWTVRARIIDWEQLYVLLLVNCWMVRSYAFRGWIFLIVIN